MPLRPTKPLRPTESLRPAMTPRGNASTDQHQRLFAIFLSCRTTLEDLSRRTKTFGGGLSVALLANYLVGRSTVSAATHNVVADAINARLRELSKPPDAPYRAGP